MKKNGWTIPRKRNERAASNDSPGPGEYFPLINNGTPAYTIAGKNKHKPKVYEGPGPETYFPSIHPIKPRPKSANFTSGRKNIKNINEPGPGEYYLGSLLGGPAASIKGRPKALKKSNYPGPGQYSDKYKTTKPRAASAKIGKSKRMARYKEGTPGPGHYQGKDLKDKRGVKFGSSTRPATAKTIDSPGPGAYSIGSTIGQKSGKTMAGKRRQTSIDNTPGPGMYNLKMDRGPAYTLQGKYSRDYDEIEKLK